MTTAAKPLPLRSLNHISRVVADVAATAAFYVHILGFHEIKRPQSFEFEGCWLFNYGIGIHLIKGNPIPRPNHIVPASDHLSFQADSINEVESRLNGSNITYKKNIFVEDGLQVKQLFFHDPDNNMIEICNCDVLPVVVLDDAKRCCRCSACHSCVSSGGVDSVMPPLHTLQLSTDSDDCSSDLGRLSNTPSDCGDSSSPCLCTCSSGDSMPSFNNDMGSFSAEASCRSGCSAANESSGLCVACSSVPDERTGGVGAHDREAAAAAVAAAM